MLLYLLESHTSENINDGICNVMYCLEMSILMLFLRTFVQFHLGKQIENGRNGCKKSGLPTQLRKSKFEKFFNSAKISIVFQSKNVKLENQKLKIQNGNFSNC